MCVDWNKAGTLDPRHTTVWLEDDPLSPSLFPYSLASVCVRWLRILSCVAVYWTRQVITVDSHATSLITIQNLLQWVGHHPLQLILTRHPGVSEETDRDEHARVRAVLDLLQPRIHQIWSLTLDVRYSSLLSTLRREEGDVQYLGALTLMSGRSDKSSTAGLPRSPELPLARNSNMPSPTHSFEDALDGHFFTGALASEEQCNLWFCNTTSLTTQGYTTSDGSRISLQEFITRVQTLRLLQRLTVEDISFVNDLHPSHRFLLEAPVICLRNITDGDAVGCILSQSLGGHFKEAVTVSNCPFSGFGKRSSFRRRINSTSLILEGVNASTSAIQQLVCFWNGENLSLIDCPGVSASFLRGVRTKETPLKLRRLWIVDCENVSVGGLIALVRLRELQAVIDALVPYDPDEEPCEALVELHVHGKGPPIGGEQAVWFAEHVDTFSWDTIASDGTRYTWDAAGRELTVLPTYT